MQNLKEILARVDPCRPVKIRVDQRRPATIGVDGCRGRPEGESDQAEGPPRRQWWLLGQRTDTEGARTSSMGHQRSRIEQDPLTTGCPVWVAKSKMASFPDWAPKQQSSRKWVKESPSATHRRHPVASKSERSILGDLGDAAAQEQKELAGIGKPSNVVRRGPSWSFVVHRAPTFQNVRIESAGRGG